jgi:hypothetical protein
MCKCVFIVKKMFIKLQVWHKYLYTPTKGDNIPHKNK